MARNGSNGRDRRGRWQKGFCPNPNGRPHKQPRISDSDVGYFKQTIVDVTIAGERRQLTRHELLLHSMFEQALKGKVSVMRKLFDRFEDVDMTMVQAAEMLRERREAFLERREQGGKFDLKEGEAILKLQEMLNYGRKLKPRRAPRMRRNPGAPTWRRGPKPQAVLDLEREWARADRVAEGQQDPDPSNEPEDS